MVAIFTLIIVDDEKNILKNISKGIPWEDFNFSLEGSFTSAKSALDFLEHSKVDCIISDIKMPEIDGLKFAEIVYQKYPGTNFIILSAYQDFSYAQLALRYNVSDYIVKPVTYAKIKDALTNVVANIKKSHPYFQYSYSPKHKLVSSILDGKFTDSAQVIEEFAKEGLTINPDTTPFALIKICVENFDDFLKNSWSYDVLQFQNAFSYIVESSMPYVIKTSSGYGYINVLLIYEDGSFLDFLNFINKTLSQISDNYFEFLNCNVEFEIISIYGNINDIINANLSKKHFEIHAGDLLNLIVSGNVSETLKFLEEKFLEYRDNTSYLKLFSKCLITDINNLIDINEIYKDFSIEILLDSEIQHVETITKKIADKAAVYFLNKSRNTSNIIKTAKDYINEYYAGNITLSDLANLVHISESHFSRTFKQKTGESVVAYVNRVRLNHARELLLTSDLSVEEIYCGVGYKSRNLFFKNFKALYGITPNKYRMENSDEF